MNAKIAVAIYKVGIIVKYTNIGVLAEYTSRLSPAVNTLVFTRDVY